MAQAESAQEYLTVAYTEAKPALARAMRIHLDNLDPVADEPSLRLLTQIVERQERHRTGTAASTPTSRPCRCGCARPRASFGSSRRSTSRRRDDFVEVTERVTRTSRASCT